MSKETKALNRISTTLGGTSKAQKKDILNEIAENVDGLAGVEIYICGNGEYDTETGLPTVTDKDEKTIYLTPTGEDVPNMYNEYIWKGDAWELFGSSSGGIKNLCDGSAAGSIRSINSKAEEFYTGGIGTNAVAVGSDTEASGYSSHAEGSYAIASDAYAHAEGYKTKATNTSSHAEGSNTTASNTDAHAEGYETTASGKYAHAEGNTTTAGGQGSHAEGSNTTASQTSSHAEGESTTASGARSHAEGWTTTSSGESSHAEGGNTTASGLYAHAEGYNAKASGKFAHAEGNGTSADKYAQHVFGELNLVDSMGSAATRGTYVEIVGNGTQSKGRSNARTLSWTGDESLAGSLTLGMGTADETTITAAQLKQLLAMLS